MADYNLRKIAVNMGFRNELEMTVKFVLPIIGICIFIYMFMVLFLKGLPTFVPYFVLVMGAVFVVAYPYALVQKKKVNITENLHFFITYAGTISTLHITRGVFFKRIGKKEEFGEISKISERIHYLAKRWTLGFAVTCRKIARLVPSEIFADFLDRFATILDFGEELEVFLTEEQESIMEDYSVEYKKALEYIKLLQEIFVSLTILLSFLMAISLLLPILQGIAMSLVLKISLGALIIMDGFLFAFVKMFIPADRLAHNLPLKDEGYKKTQKSFFIIAPISIVLAVGLIYLNKLPFLVNVAIAATPFMITGWYANEEENIIIKRDKAFVPFIRALGVAIDVRHGGIPSGLRALRVHDFGVVNEMVTHLYRRLRLGCDKYQSWMYFSATSGSSLIQHFSHIFAEGVYMGGVAEKIAHMVSTNFLKLLSLRKLRLELTSGLRGALYGSLVGFAAVSYIAAQITVTLSNLFNVDTGSEALFDFIGSIVPSTGALAINLQEISVYIGLMIIVHALVSCFVMKMVEGGIYYGIFLDFVVMLWIGAILSWVLPPLIQNLLPSVSAVPGVT